MSTPASSGTATKINRFPHFWRADRVKDLGSFQSPDLGGCCFDVVGVSDNENLNVECRKCMPGFQMPHGYSGIGAKGCALPLFPPCQDGPKMKYGEIFLERYANPRSQISIKRGLKKRLDSARNELGKDKTMYKGLKDVFHQIHFEKNNCELNIPASVMQLAESLPLNWKQSYKYLGIYDGEPNFSRNGCIAICAPSPDWDQMILFHSYGKKNTKLSLSTIPKKMPLKAEECVESVADPLEFEETLFNLNVAVTGKRIYCGMRFKDNFRLGSFEEYEYAELCTVAPDSGCFIRDFAICPYLNEFICIDNNGKLVCRDIERNADIWASKQSRFKNKIDPWWSCEYGAHPMCAVISHRSGCYLRDFRYKMKKVVHILSTPFEFLMGNEQIHCHTRSPGNCFRHWIGCDNTLLLMDERFPDQPVMLWDHMMDSPPHLCHAAVLSDAREIFLLANENDNEMAAFLVGKTDLNPVSLMPPLYLSSPNDMTNFLLRDGYNINAIIEARLTAPRTGILAVPLGEVFLALQRTSAGDIFYQYFNGSEDNVEKSYRFRPDCPAGFADEQNIIFATKWCEEATRIINQLEEKRAASSCEKRTQIYPNYDISDALKPFLNRQQVKHREGCALCCKCGKESERHTTGLSNVCGKCEIHGADAKKICAIANKSGVLAGPVIAMDELPTTRKFQRNLLRQVASFDPNRVTTYLDRKIVSMWEDADIEDVFNSTDEEEANTETVDLITQTPETQKRVHSLVTNVDDDDVSKRLHLDHDRDYGFLVPSNLMESVRYERPPIREDSLVMMPPSSQEFDWPASTQEFQIGDADDFDIRPTQRMLPRDEFLAVSMPDPDRFRVRSDKSISKKKSLHTSGF